MPGERDDRSLDSILQSKFESRVQERYYSGCSTLPHVSVTEDQPCASILPTNHESGNDATGLEICVDLPERPVGDALVDCYFQVIHPLFPVLHEGRFRKEYHAIYDQGPIARHGQLAILGLVNMVFVLGCRQLTISDFGIFRARAKGIILHQMCTNGSLQTVQSLLLRSYLLRNPADLEECWNLTGLAIRMASTLELHLDPGSAVPLVQRESQKRTWWGCVVLDRALSMNFGRPTFVRAEDCNVSLPLDIDDEYIHDGIDEPFQPTGIWSKMAFFNATIRLCEIVQQMLVQLYSQSASTCQGETDWSKTKDITSPRMLSNAMDLDDQLLAWWRTVLAHLKPECGFQDGEVLKKQRLALRMR